MHSSLDYLIAVNEIQKTKEQMYVQIQGTVTRYRLGRVEAKLHAFLASVVGVASSSRHAPAVVFHGMSLRSALVRLRSLQGRHVRGSENSEPVFARKVTRTTVQTRLVNRK
jgi:hypothetical protein